MGLFCAVISGLACLDRNAFTPLRAIFHFLKAFLPTPYWGQSLREVLFLALAAGIYAGPMPGLCLSLAFRPPVPP